MTLSDFQGHLAISRLFDVIFHTVLQYPKRLQLTEHRMDPDTASEHCR